MYDLGKGEIAFVGCLKAEGRWAAKVNDGWANACLHLTEMCYNAQIR